MEEKQKSLTLSMERKIRDNYLSIKESGWMDTASNVYLTMKRELIAYLLIFFCLWMRSTCQDDSMDYDYGDEQDIEDCHSEIEIKTFKKTPKLTLCDSLQNPSAKSRVQLQIFTNHSEGKARFRAVSIAKPSTLNKSLVALTTDILDDFTHATSLLTIDDYQLIGPSILVKLVQGLINRNLNLLSRNMKKTLILPKADPSSLLSCKGNFYPKQDTNALNITSDFTEAIKCTKEPQNDRFFTLQEKLYLLPANKNTFRLADLHADDPKKVSRASWYTCNNPTVCTHGIQQKVLLDKTVLYAMKFLQKPPVAKKAASG